MNEWKMICKLSDIPVLGARVAHSAAGNIALFRTEEDEVYALTDRCPHKGGPLSQGIVHGKRVTCPLHGFNIELASGEAVAPDHGCAGRHEVRLSEGDVYLRMDALAMRGAGAEQGVQLCAAGG